MKKRTFKLLALGGSIVFMSLFTGCASKPVALPTPENVDLKRFMGRWYVVGYTPIVVDKEAHNAIEHYRLDEDAKIQTTYQFRDGGYDAEIKTFTPVGWVHDHATNAEWRMQFVWPLRSDYIILHIDDDYTETIVVHPNRKYAWIMTRSPDLSTQDYERMLQQLQDVGYDLELIKRLPQNWSNENERLEQLKAEGL